MGLFSLKGKLSFLGRSRATLAELQALGETTTKAGLATVQKLTEGEVATALPKVALVATGALPHVLAAHAASDIAARFPFSGDAPGLALTFFTKDDARRLVELMLAKPPGAVKSFGALEESAIAEMTNIALNGCINAVAEATGARFATGVPEVKRPVKDLAAFLAFDAAGTDHVVVVETPFEERSRGVKGTMVVVFGVKAEAET